MAAMSAPPNLKGLASPLNLHEISRADKTHHMYSKAAESKNQIKRALVLTCILEKMETLQSEIGLDNEEFCCKEFI